MDGVALYIDCFSHESLLSDSILSYNVNNFCSEGDIELACLKLKLNTE